MSAKDNTGNINEVKESPVSMAAPPKNVALKLPPLTPGKGAKGGAKGEFAKDGPLSSKGVLGESPFASERVLRAEAKTPPPADTKSPRTNNRVEFAPIDTTPNRPHTAAPETSPAVAPASLASSASAPTIKPTPASASEPAATTATGSTASVKPVAAKAQPATTPAAAANAPAKPAGTATAGAATAGTPNTAVTAKPKAPTKKEFLAKIQARKSIAQGSNPPVGSPAASGKTFSASGKEGSSTKDGKLTSSNKEAPKDAKTLQEEQRAKDWQRAKSAIEKFAESPFFVSLMAVLTIWALYNSDIKFAATDKDADLAFEVIISIAFFLFILEIAMSCVYKPDYWWLPDWKPLEDEEWYETWIRRCQVGSFYFWLDWLATLSLILEMTWILGDGASAVNGGGTQTANGGAQAGARAGRVVRLVRMVRLVRLIKLYKYSAVKVRTESVENETGTAEDAPAESRVGAAMSDLTNRRVIVLILLMLIVIPQLTVNDIDISLSLGVQFIHELGRLNATDPATYSSGLNLAIQTVQNELPLLYMNLNGNVVYNDADKYDSLRASERATYELNDNNFYTRMSYDQKDVSVQNALFSIYTTSFIIVLLIGGVYFFLSDVNRLVIGPIERLVDLVRKISANPLGVEYKVLGAEEGFLEGLETTVLLTTITKIGALMRVGFGEAGASVIARNLAESSGGRLNLMGAGTMIRSIFGFCDVRQFTDATECLQEEVMLFVNRIAHILHSIVVQCSGAANKNIGDAFLLTWKLDEKLTVAQVASLADQALLAFMKSLIELSRYQEFIVNFSLAATARLYKRFPEYNVRIGSGLHVGWAIEGAIGSHRKIDASYLSPHVNNTEYLESSTKQYGVPLLLSEPFFRLLSPAAAKYCRQVDRIRRSEFEEPMGLYAYDADLDIDWNDLGRHLKFNVKNKLMDKVRQARTKNAENMRLAQLEALPAGNKVPHHPAAISASDPKMLSRSRRGSALSRLVGLAPPAPVEEPVSDEKKQELANLEARAQRAKQTPTVVIPKYTEAIWTTDQDLIDQRHKVNDSFRALWENGINAYIRGDWGKARDIFDETMRLSKKKDGPSKFIIEIINEHGGAAPQDWPGYRADY